MRFILSGLLRTFAPLPSSSLSNRFAGRALFLVLPVALVLACGSSTNGSAIGGAADGGGGMSGSGSGGGSSGASSGASSGSSGGLGTGSSGEGGPGSSSGTMLEGGIPTGPSPIVIPPYAWTPPPGAGNPDGAPIGGLGAGTISWRFDGMFYLTRLDIAADGGDQFPSHHTDPNAAFYMYQSAGGQVTTRTLNASDPAGNPGKYYSLFPKAWFDYSGAGLSCKVKVEQFRTHPTTC